jgi:hypothetical protein
MKPGTIAGLITAAIFIIAVNRGCDYLTERKVMRGEVYVNGARYHEACRHLRRADSCDIADKAYPVILKLYKRYAWSDSKAIEKRVRQIMVNPCGNLKKKVSFKDSQLAETLGEIGYIILLFYIAYIPFTGPISIVLLILIVQGTISALIKAGTTAATDKPPKPEQEKKEEIWDEIEKL